MCSDAWYDIVYMYISCLTSSTFPSTREPCPPSTREPCCEFVDFTPFHTHFGMGQVTYYWHTVDGQIIQTPHPWVVGYPLSPQISTLWFRIFVPDLRVWFISSIRRSEPNQKNNIVIGGAGGYWITRVWIIRPSTVRGAVVSRSAENVKGNFS